jgi:pimeloyl-ACP methyl ester carboxylesterase
MPKELSMKGNQIMKNRNTISTTVLLVLACFSLSITANIAMADQNVSFRVQLRPHVFANVVSTVVTNPSFPTGGMTVLTVHGFAHTGSTFGNLTQAIFNSPQYGSSVSNVVSVDLLGHGLSSGPILEDGGQLQYGELSIEDYATAVTETIRRLGALQLRPQVVIAHSWAAW